MEKSDLVTLKNLLENPGGFYLRAFKIYFLLSFSEKPKIIAPAIKIKTPVVSSLFIIAAKPISNKNIPNTFLNISISNSQLI